MSEKKINEIIERSEFVEELLGKVPPVILRLGISFLFAFISAILILCYFIKYPETVDSRIVITPEIPGVRIVSPTSGRIKELFIKNKSFVKEGGIIALIDNPSKFEDIVSLEIFLAQLKKTESIEEIENIQVPNMLNLGSIQSLFADLTLNIKNLKNLLKINSVKVKEYSIESDINFLNQIYLTLKSQLQLSGAKLQNAKINFDRYQELLKNRVISKRDFEEVETSYLQTKFDYESVNNQITNNRNQFKQKSLLLIQSRSEFLETAENQFIALKEKIQTIYTLIETWKQTYLVRSPINGKVSFHKIWVKDQFINNGQELFIVLPKKESKLFGKMDLPELNSGKVKVGQRVIVKIDGYNYKEYGVLIGRVKEISLTTKENFYAVDVWFPEKLVTSYGKLIPKGKERLGSASVVTEEINLIDRIFYNIKSAFKND